MEAAKEGEKELILLWEELCSRHGKAEASRLWMALFAGKDTPET